MVNKAKKKVEEIKKEAKTYYKGKNMTFRYIVIVFLCLLIGIQFILPKKNDTIPKEEKQIIKEYPDKQTLFGSYVDTNIVYDRVYADIAGNKENIKYLYKKYYPILNNLQNELKKENINLDFQYLLLLNEYNDFPRFINKEAIKDYGLYIDKDIDERLNFEKSTNLVISYLSDLYDKFEDWNLVFMGYFIGSKNLQNILDYQGQTIFDNLYFDSDLKEEYFRLLAYKNVFENIDKYINTSDLEFYHQPNMDYKNIKKIDNISSWADENGYTFKELKELNPWILGDEVPKGKREIKVYSKTD